MKRESVNHEREEETEGGVLSIFSSPLLNGARFSGCVLHITFSFENGFYSP